MGLLDQVIGSVVGQVLGGGRGHPQAQGGGLAGGIGGALSNPVVKALLMLVLAKAASGGLGNIFGGGGGQPAPTPRGRLPQREDDGDLGGFGQGGHEGGGHDGGGYDDGDRDFGQGRPRGGARSNDGGDFSDLSGMLDGPGDRGAQSPGRGPYAHLDREPHQGGGPIGGGLDGLIQSFERGGLGDVIGSWIGQGRNQPIPPNRLADALGDDTVDTLSRQTGLDRDALLQQLAVALPSVVDQLTPNGRVPSEEEQRHWL